MSHVVRRQNTWLYHWNGSLGTISHPYTGSYSDRCVPGCSISYWESIGVPDDGTVMVWYAPDDTSECSNKKFMSKFSLSKIFAAWAWKSRVYRYRTYTRIDSEPAKKIPSRDSIDRHHLTQRYIFATLCDNRHKLNANCTLCPQNLVGSISLRLLQHKSCRYIWPWSFPLLSP